MRTLAMSLLAIGPVSRPRYVSLLIGRPHDLADRVDPRHIAHGSSAIRYRLVRTARLCWAQLIATAATSVLSFSRYPSSSSPYSGPTPSRFLSQASSSARYTHRSSWSPPTSCRESCTWALSASWGVWAVRELRSGPCACLLTAYGSVCEPS